MKQSLLSSLGIEIPHILLPKNADLQKWSVIACDQFTQDRTYWEKVKEIADNGGRGLSPSALNLIFPEIFLSDNDACSRIESIHLAMERYLKEGIFSEPKKGFIYTERDTPFNKKRRGLIAAVDLEQYDWKSGSMPLIRCTEGTLPERLPPRMDIRRGAPLELPHILILIDDDTDSLLPGLAQMISNDAPVYETQLMMDSGKITGWFLDTEKPGSPYISFISEKLEELCCRSVSRYAGNGQMPFLFAVGDGNHSLAAAKGIWEEYKAAGADMNHPSRYALVEIENIYDPAIQFGPIHRIIFGMNFNGAVSLLSKLPDYNCRYAQNAEEISRLCSRMQAADAPSAVNYFGIVSQGRYALIETSAAGVSTVCLQPLLDSALEKDNSLSIDYIHDTKEIFRLTNENVNSAGILLPPVKKSFLFETVARSGPLPRKSFSMGHACEKRFYLECRMLVSSV